MTRIDCSGGPRTLLLLVVLFATVLGVIACRPGRARPLLACEESDDAQMDLMEELEQQNRGVLARLRRKDELAREVVEGRQSVLEAAARFRALDQGPPAFYWDRFREGTPGNSDEERHCREVIRFVENHLSVTDPCLGLAIAARLERKLEEYLRLGSMSLPDLFESHEVADADPDRIALTDPGKARWAPRQ